MASPQPVIASARRSESAPRKFDTFDPEKAFCITVKPISMTISTRPPISPGDARSLVNVPMTVKPAAATQTSSRNQVGISITARSEPRAAMLRTRMKPMPATVAIEMRATPAAIGAL